MSPFTNCSSSFYAEPVDWATAQRVLERAGSTGSTAQQSEFHELLTPLGPRRYPRVSSISNLLQGQWIAAWAKRVDRESWLTTATLNLRSTMLGDSPLISRDQAVTSLTCLSPAWESDRVRNAAAARGTKTHAAIEAHLRGSEVELDPELVPGFNAWLAWYRESGLRAVQVEQRVGCWVEGYVGTVDVVLEDKDGARYVGDWKRAKSIAGIPYKCQIGAYAHAIAATYPDNPIAGGMLIKIPQTGRGAVDMLRFTAAELHESFQAFCAALTIFRYTRRATGEDAGDDPLPGEGHA